MEPVGLSKDGITTSNRECDGLMSNFVSGLGFDHAVVINLDHRPDRLARMEKILQQQKIAWQRLPAVGVRDLGDDQPSEALRAFLEKADGQNPNADQKLLTTWACMRSHMAVIRMARDAGWPSVLVLEDDCEFEPYTFKVLQRVAKQLKTRDWGMVYLGGTLKRGSVNQCVSENLRKISRLRLAHAYVVHASLYDRILSEVAESGLPIDWYYSETLQPTINAYLVRPKLAHQRCFDMSDIEQVERQPKRKTRERLQRWLATLRYGGAP